MIEVHHLNNSRSQRVLWMLEELGVPYTVVRYERDAKTMLAPPELKNIHPLGRSPVIRDGDFVLAESGAIIEYLVEHYGAGRFVPERGTREYEACRYWVHYAEGSLMMQLLVKLYLDRVGEPAKPMRASTPPICSNAGLMCWSAASRPSRCWSESIALFACTSRTSKTRLALRNS